MARMRGSKFQGGTQINKKFNFRLISKIPLAFFVYRLFELQSFAKDWRILIVLKTEKCVNLWRVNFWRANFQLCILYAAYSIKKCDEMELYSQILAFLMRIGLKRQARSIVVKFLGFKYFKNWMDGKKFSGWNFSALNISLFLWSWNQIRVTANVELHISHSDFMLVCCKLHSKVNSLFS